MSEELKPCPWETVKKDFDHRTYYDAVSGCIRCNCGASGPVSAWTEESAITAWNTRTPDHNSVVGHDVPDDRIISEILMRFKSNPELKKFYGLMLSTFFDYSALVRQLVEALEGIEQWYREIADTKAIESMGDRLYIMYHALNAAKENGYGQ